MRWHSLNLLEPRKRQKFLEQWQALRRPNIFLPDFSSALFIFQVAQKLFNLSLNAEILEQSQTVTSLTAKIHLWNDKCELSTNTPSHKRLPCNRKADSEHSASPLHSALAPLKASRLFSLFPFHFVVNADAKLTSMGRCLTSIMNFENFRRKIKNSDLTTVDQHFGIQLAEVSVFVFLIFNA